jgi:hypothetical protein
MKRNIRAVTLIELLIAVSLFSLGSIAITIAIQWTVDGAYEMNGGSIFQKDLDTIIRQELDASSKYYVTTDHGSAALTATGKQVVFEDLSGSPTYLYLDTESLYLKRGTQPAITLVRSGIKSGDFDVSEGVLKINIDTDLGKMSNRYEHRKSF